MRTEKELWQIVLDHIDELESGLCGLIWDLLKEYIISREEYDLLLDILGEESENYEDTFWFPRGVKEPRIEWLKNKIASL
jgi:hypothetical protein